MNRILKFPLRKPGQTRRGVHETYRILQSWPLKVIWLVVSTYPSEKCEFVSWDNEIPKI